jgi:isopenicillin-N epimerase
VTPATLSDHRAELWPLDPAVLFLNHGSFGACPTEVIRHQAALRDTMEAEPVRFLSRELDDRLDEARQALAGFVGADADDLAFVVNATSGVNAVLRSLDFSPDDELLTTNHAYNACRNALDFVAARSGARVVVVTIPFPVTGPDEVVDTVMARVTPRTRLALLDHVTSPTALVVPIERLAGRLAERGVELLVDGAHAPGMRPLDLRALGATYYTGNCHKWLCAPKGSAFLWVRRDRQRDARPLTISHGANVTRSERSRFRLEFDWTGTADPTAWLTVPKAIEYLGSLVPGGWPALMARNRALALEARRLLCAAAGTPPPCPDEMVGSLASVVLPDGRAGQSRDVLWATVGRGGAPTANQNIGWRRPDPLQRLLYEAWGIEVPVMSWPAAPRRLIRVSAQLYNSREHYARLAEALGKELAAERTG